MPFDMSPQELETVTKPEVGSMASLIAWLETMPPEGKYDYWDVGNCLLCQYGRAMGYGVSSAGGHSFTFGRAGRIENAQWADVVCPRTGPQNFGAALSRARALLAKP